MSNNSYLCEDLKETGEIICHTIKMCQNQTKTTEGITYKMRAFGKKGTLRVLHCTPMVLKEEHVNSTK